MTEQLSRPRVADLTPLTVHGERQPDPDAVRAAHPEGDGLALHLDHLALNLGEALAHLAHEGGERDRGRAATSGASFVDLLWAQASADRRRSAPRIARARSLIGGSTLGRSRPGYDRPTRGTSTRSRPGRSRVRADPRRAGTPSPVEATVADYGGQALAQVNRPRQVLVPHGRAAALTGPECRQRVGDGPRGPRPQRHAVRNIVAELSAAIGERQLPHLSPMLGRWPHDPHDALARLPPSGRSSRDPSPRWWSRRWVWRPRRRTRARDPPRPDRGRGRTG